MVSLTLDQACGQKDGVLNSLCPLYLMLGKPGQVTDDSPRWERNLGSSQWNMHTGGTFSAARYRQPQCMLIKDLPRERQVSVGTGG